MVKVRGKPRKVLSRGSISAFRDSGGSRTKNRLQPESRNREFWNLEKWTVVTIRFRHFETWVFERPGVGRHGVSTRKISKRENPKSFRGITLARAVEPISAFRGPGSREVRFWSHCIVNSWFVRSRKYLSHFGNSGIGMTSDFGCCISNFRLPKS
jgi:hypothetical protein